MLETITALLVLSTFGPGEAGTAAFPLLRVPLGPAACALGEAFTAVAEGPAGLYWNPGGLGRVAQVQFGLGHHEWFAGIRDEHLALTAPLGPGAIGASIIYSTVRGIEIAVPDRPPGALATSGSGYAAIGYGLPLTRSLSCGVSIKGIYDDLITQTGTGICGDVGIIYEPRRDVRLGLAGRNLGPGVYYDGERYGLPAVASLGLGVTVAAWRALLDLNLPVAGTPEVHAGIEHMFRDLLSLRAGYRLGPQDHGTLSLLSGLTGGVGLSVRPLSVDYSIASYGGLGFVHRLSLNVMLQSPFYGRIRIRTAEFGTASPIKAQLVLEGTQQGRSYTEPNGTFVIDGIDPGWVKVTATADGYYPAIESVLVEPRGSQPIQLQLLKSGYGSLWGVVADSGTRIPVPSRVSWYGPEADAIDNDPANGSFVLRRLRSGDYTFCVTPLDTGWQGKTATITIPHGLLVSQTFLLRRRASAGPSHSASPGLDGLAPSTPPDRAEEPPTELSKDEELNEP